MKSNTDVLFIEEMTVGDFRAMVDRRAEEILNSVREDAKKHAKEDLDKLKQKLEGGYASPQKPILGTNGSILYSSTAGAPGCESISAREESEKYWRSLGKKIRKGSKI